MLQKKVPTNLQAVVSVLKRERNQQNVRERVLSLTASSCPLFSGPTKSSNRPYRRAKTGEKNTGLPHIVCVSNSVSVRVSVCA